MFSLFKTDVIGKRNTDSKFDLYYQFAVYKVLDYVKLTTKGKYCCFQLVSQNALSLSLSLSLSNVIQPSYYLSTLETLTCLVTKPYRTQI